MTRLRLSFIALLALAATYALPATDNFNRADALTLGSDWTVQVTGFRIVSNEARGINPALRQLVFWNADSFNDDQYSQFVIKGNASAPGGPSVRASGASPTENVYYAFLRDTGVGNSHIFKQINGTDTSLANASIAWAVDDLAKLEVVGTTLTVYKNGVATALTVSDATLSSGSAGMMDNGAGMNMDDWQGGNVGGGVPCNRGLMGVGCDYAWAPILWRPRVGAR